MAVQPKRLSITLFFGFILVALNAIMPFTGSARLFAQTTPQVPPQATALLRGTPTPLLRGTTTGQGTTRESQRVTPTPRATATALPTPTATAAGEYYGIDQRSLSEQLPDIALAVRSATLTTDQLILTVAFENRSDGPIRFSFISAVDAERIQLIDRNGALYPPTAADERWLAIQPAGGFVTEGANLGAVAFARPIGPGPYQLTGIFDYPPIEFALDQPTATTAPIAVPNGLYPIDATLFSNDEVLEPLRLHIEHLALDDETVTFTIGFVNTGYRQYALRRGPTGMDAALLDIDRHQFAPQQVSASLADTITPAQGIAAGTSYTGTITFPRPAELTELRFDFARYTPLTLRFGPSGLRSSSLATSANATPPPTPTPQADIAIYHALRSLLAAQSAALLAGDMETFLQGITPEIRPTVGHAFTQLATMPLATVALTLDPGQDYTVARAAQMAAVTVRLRYTLAGVPADNPFVQEFLVDFLYQADDSTEQIWQISSIEPQNNTPFWWHGTVITDETPHFLIITRPAMAMDLALLAEEVESAYAAVANQNLALEDRYVAYFTGPDESFSTYTGATNPNILGVALSRYQIDALSIAVVSRAFYINGQHFADAARIGERQSTITHELVHLALAHNARPFTPPWLAEGLALYYAGQESAVDRSNPYNREQFATIDLTALTRLSSLGIHDATGESSSYRYLYSGAVIAYLVEQYGEEQLLAFYQSYAAVEMADIEDRLPLYANPLGEDRAFQALSVEVTEEQLTANFNLSLATLDAAVKEWLLAE